MPLAPEKSIERSADSLQKLYTVIVALAVSQAITAFLKDKDTIGAILSRESLASLPALIAFLATLVPFYHGMNRHLDRCYLERDAGPRQASLLLDFCAFFVESFCLLAVAWAIRKGLLAFFFLGLLLVVDCMWGVVSHLIHSPGRSSTVKKWALINIVFVALGFGAALTTVFPADTRSWILGLLAILRSGVDYGICWTFYFPPGSVEVA